MNSRRDAEAQEAKVILDRLEQQADRPVRELQEQVKLLREALSTHVNYCTFRHEFVPLSIREQARKALEATEEKS